MVFRAYSTFTLRYLGGTLGYLHRVIKSCSPLARSCQIYFTLECKQKKYKCNSEGVKDLNGTEVFSGVRQLV